MAPYHVRAEILARVRRWWCWRHNLILLPRDVIPDKKCAFSGFSTRSRVSAIDTASNFSAPDRHKISYFSLTRKIVSREFECKGRIIEVREKKKRGRRVIDEWRWSLSSRFPPTRPDKIKLLEDGRKYRGSTRSCRSRGETTSAWGGIGEREQDENESRDDRTSGQPQGTWEGGWRAAACWLCHVTLFYSFFGPVVTLMSSYTRRGRDRSATRPDITSRATQLRAKGLSCDLRGDGIKTDGGERAIYSGTTSPRASSRWWYSTYTELSKAFEIWYRIWYISNSCLFNNM